MTSALLRSRIAAVVLLYANHSAGSPSSPSTTATRSCSGSAIRHHQADPYRGQTQDAGSVVHCRIGGRSYQERNRESRHYDGLDMEQRGRQAAAQVHLGMLSILGVQGVQLADQLLGGGVKDMPWHLLRRQVCRARSSTTY
ncbi:hypothetical protein [Actinoplanes sp. NPDC020271]|uniref:hypothetical protein n=1 Tax=Actinoplanes sp. NPDC020271 TaxID=3363896 RepID=UPI0037892B00